MPKKIVGTAEIADLASVTAGAVSNWLRRWADFPKPLADLAMGPIFDKAEVLTWLREKGKMRKKGA